MHKFLKIVVALLSLIGIVSLFRIIAEGNEGMKKAFASGDTTLFEPMAWVAYIILALTLVLVVFFVLKGLFTHTSSLKSTLIGVGVFLAILAIAFVVSAGDERAYFYNNMQATANESQLVGGGLIAFYVLAVIAVLSMVFTGIKKMIR
ncbi:hypothetical protein N7U66_10630 [Lacinutrix neustonica]|uniref:Uncharacterized protein n=1 Tax=Lacinutrix neustonica TaxID=2980107 RepID=A0A9E8N0F5_9FLAO|nr:hypothetical protein [Lacinutrix neustonica]WAC03822.1 hypothetical protein N7U66_10630 [Lacinutrix neustonica]